MAPETILSETELSVRVQNALAGIGITAVGQLSQLSLQSVATIGNIGPKGLQELYEFCLRHALKSELRSQAEITGLPTEQGLAPDEIKALMNAQPHDQIRISASLCLSQRFCRRLHTHRIHTLADLTARARDELVIDALQLRPSLVMELDTFLTTTQLILKPVSEYGAWRLYAYHMGPRPLVDPARPLDTWVEILGEYHPLVDDLKDLNYRNLAEVLKDYPGIFVERHHYNPMQLTLLGKRLQFLGFDVPTLPETQGR